MLNGEHDAISGSRHRARTEFFDGDGFRDRLAALVAIPSTSQDPGHVPDVQRYLADAIQPWLRRSPSRSTPIPPTASARS